MFKCLVLTVLLIHVVSAQGEQVGHEVYGPLRPPDCGSSNVSNLLKTGINESIPAKLGSWPWIAALGYRDSKNSSAALRWLCGGSLISRKHVLTAAHCVQTDDLYLARFRDLNLKHDDDEARPVDIVIEQKVVHPEYNAQKAANDIAVLILIHEVITSDLIHPICLPIDEPLRSDDFYLKNAFIAGWGANPDQGPSSDVLLQQKSPVINNKECKQIYINYTNLIISDKSLCAGYKLGGKDSCRGDNGGPLMLVQESAVYQIGVDCYSYKCAEPGFPTVYNRITEYLDFIIPILQ